ncbi:MAG: hypothetical protein K6G61_06410 [Solobacterium sp.]|nr:hypothetical protein [Solobacterium sp.]
MKKNNRNRVEQTITIYETKIVYRHPTKPLTLVSDGTIDNTRVLINRPEDAWGAEIDHAYSLSELLSKYADQIIEDYYQEHYPEFNNYR